MQKYSNDIDLNARRNPILIVMSWLHWGYMEAIYDAVNIYIIHCAVDITHIYYNILC